MPKEMRQPNSRLKPLTISNEEYQAMSKRKTKAMGKATKPPAMAVKAAATMRKEDIEQFRGFCSYDVTDRLEDAKEESSKKHRRALIAKANQVAMVAFTMESVPDHVLTAFFNAWHALDGDQMDVHDRIICKRIEDATDYCYRYVHVAAAWQAEAALVNPAEVAA
jgi:hypothetical protein